MGTTAEKLTYLNTTKGKIKDSINLTGAGITSSDTFRSYAVKLNKGYVDIINNGIDQLYSNFPKVSGKGSNLSLTPTYEAPMGISVYGDTYQNGTPTPSSPIPIESVAGLQKINITGKNLFSGLTKGIKISSSDGSENTDSTAAATDFIPVDFSNTNYIISGYPNTLYNFVAAYNSNKVFLGRTAAGTTSPRTLTSSSFTSGTPQGTGDIAYIRFTIYENSSYPGVIDDVDNAQIQLEKGSATSYEPYTGTTYEVNLGKNLFDINGTFTGNLIKYNNGFQLIKNSTNRTINYLPASPIPKGTYTLSYEIVSSTLSDINKLTIQFFNANNTNILTKTLSATGSLNCILTEDVVKIYFYISNSEETDTQITLDNIQIEKGSTATSYSSYFTPIELNKIGDYEDSIKKSSGKNLFDKSTITTGQYIDASGNLVNDNSNFVGDYIPIDNTKSYYASQIAGGVIRVGYYDSNKTFISRQLISANYGSLTIPNNAVYVRLSCYNQSLDTLQLEIGTQQTSYEPYGKVWYIEKNTRKLELAIADMNNNEDYPGWTGLTQLRNDVYNGYNSGSFNYYTDFYNNISGYNSNGIGSNFNNQAKLYLKTGTFNLTQTQWINTYPNLIFSLLYKLNTPTYETITNEELIKELESIKSKNGTTNISVSSEYLPAILDCSALKVVD